jgi:nucleotide-binding universal stress UspA family protein
MKARNILLPIDVAACPLEVFSFVNQYANEETVRLALLHVSKLNIVAPENRLYAEIEQEVRAVLSRLRHEFVSPRVESDICVRFGKPASEIVTEATESNSNLIVLTSHSDRHRRFFQTDIVDQVIRRAPCLVRVLRVNSRIDCATQWRLPNEELAGANRAPAFQKLPFQPHPTPNWACLRGLA